jgi:hypothetical protein
VIGFLLVLACGAVLGIVGVNPARQSEVLDASFQALRLFSAK